jgi:hypothetical protein
VKRTEQYEKHRHYIESEQLDKLIDFHEHGDYHEQVFDSVSGTLEIPFPPDADDLVRLHRLVRQRRCFTVLEFGLGYSTVVMADALAKNEADWARIAERPQIRNRFMFQLFSVDASNAWIEKTRQKFPKHLIGRVHLRHSEVEIAIHNGQLCHYYRDLPDIVPDFIYLDGPSPKDVKGSINGLSFKCDERTVMSGDLLLMESTFLPGTFIIVDGRTNNARFLQRNFTRQYAVNWDRQADVTTFELVEERLGKYNLLGPDFF